MWKYLHNSFSGFFEKQIIIIDFKLCDYCLLKLPFALGKIRHFRGLKTFPFVVFLFKAFLKYQQLNFVNVLKVS